MSDALNRLRKIGDAPGGRALSADSFPGLASASIGTVGRARLFFSPDRQLLALDSVRAVSNNEIVEGWF